MTANVLEALGGLGLFLLGMVVMTDGLRGLAGDALARTLGRFTRSPSSGALSGAALTALVQSSSATTVTAVGLAGAGLLSFREALGVVFGANVGTTATGWIVALLGFKLELGLAVMPLILVGVALRLLGGPRLAATGLALSGFGLIFVGIAALQSGMAGFSGVVTPERFPGDSVLGRVQLVGIGALVTLVTQSSSAGVAMALAALDAGALSFTQAAAMVIGMDVATTVKAGIATIGGTLAARRTGLAHVVYNAITAVGAFLLLPAYVWMLGAAAPGWIAREPELALVAFHTLFNGLGVAAVLPVADRFARLMERLVPERPAPFTDRLDRGLLGEPSLAVEAVSPTLRDLVAKAFTQVIALLEKGKPEAGAREQIGLVELALAETRRYVERIPAPADSPELGNRRVSALHVIDHMLRITDRCETAERAATLHGDPALRELALRSARALGHARDELGMQRDPPEDATLDAAHRLAGDRRSLREAVLQKVSAGELGSGLALDQLDAYRWLERVTYHGWRILHHLPRVHLGTPPPLSDIPPHAEPEQDE
ncbi:MAG: Na/Pi symporter [Myxococcota bacterium]|nr:Na/Pi symporter [Myxococcota bacterium]